MKKAKCLLAWLLLTALILICFAACNPEEETTAVTDRAETEESQETVEAVTDGSADSTAATLEISTETETVAVEELKELWDFTVAGCGFGLCGS